MKLILISASRKPTSHGYKNKTKNNKNSFPGPKSFRTFEKWALGVNMGCIYLG